ncbi:MAG: putative DNA binding domain-containing protein [Clostridiales bacterium]|nr:putative DNA binding domain-containing protein [Clostridiales bacterium]
MQYENEHIEYKSQMIDDIYKEVIAFANTDGGVIYIGIGDQGNLIGIENVDETYTRLTNGIRDAIAPDVTMFVRYILQDNNVIRIEVGEGSYKPYYLKTKGIKPTGVYVRQGASSVPASPDQIRRMIKDYDGDIFEEMRALTQELSFEEAERTFKRYKVDFSEEKYIALGLRNIRDDQYTNLALILSDQCQHTTKIAVFGDEANVTFKDAKEFGGSIFRQLDDSYAYLTLCNRTAAIFKGLERIERSDYPEDALREALLNALIHRDYSYSGSIIINVNDSCMEFISIGGLLLGLSADDIRNGISQPRNRELAEIFHRLRLIESYGTGIRKIYARYKDCTKQPRIEVTPNTFKLVLPNMNANGVITENIQEATETPRVLITPQMKTVIDYLTEYGEMTDEDMQELLNIKKTRAYLLARQMNENGLIDIVGRGAAKKYKLVLNKNA